MTKSKFQTITTRVALGAGSVALAVPAFAADNINVDDVTTAISNAGAAIAVVGAAVLVMFVGAKVWKWIRTAL